MDLLPFPLLWHCSASRGHSGHENIPELGAPLSKMQSLDFSSEESKAATASWAKLSLKTQRSSSHGSDLWLCRGSKPFLRAAFLGSLSPPQWFHSFPTSQSFFSQPLSLRTSPRHSGIIFFPQHKLTRRHRKVQPREEKAHQAADGASPEQLRGLFPAWS